MTRFFHRMMVGWVQGELAESEERKGWRPGTWRRLPCALRSAAQPLGLWQPACPAQRLGEGGLYAWHIQAGLLSLTWR
jgi:hypothetical protein